MKKRGSLEKSMSELNTNDDVRSLNSGVGRVSFKVHSVKPAKRALETISCAESIGRRLACAQNIREFDFDPFLDALPVEVCSDFPYEFIDEVFIENYKTLWPFALHSLALAAHLAYAQHRPLTLSPDVIWTTILQGLSHHVRLNSDSLRDCFARHAGKETLVVLTDAPIVWPDVISSLMEEIRDRTPANVAELTSNFSTTGINERIASEIALLDVYNEFFDYEIAEVCGIPYIQLDGTVDDWTRLATKARALRRYGLDWWVNRLEPILDEFISAARGSEKKSFWEKILYRDSNESSCALQGPGGSDKLTGWLPLLFPYIQDETSGQVSARNPMIKRPRSAVETLRLPSGLSQVPFVLTQPNSKVPMEMIGGFVGIRQNCDSLALQPALGWAVRKATGIGKLLPQDQTHHLRPPLPETELIDAVKRLRDDSYLSDLVQFYRECNGGKIFVDSESCWGTIRGVADLEFADLAPVDSSPRKPTGLFAFMRWMRGSDEGLSRVSPTLLRCVDLEAGEFLAIDTIFCTVKHCSPNGNVLSTCWRSWRAFINDIAECPDPAGLLDAKVD